jgi:hypothetical protein
MLKQCIPKSLTLGTNIIQNNRKVYQDKMEVDIVFERMEEKGV